MFSVLVIRLRSLRLLRVSGIVMRLRMFLFFFQAEDGIRALYVTGVQTCALPILSTRRPASRTTANASGSSSSRVSPLADRSEERRVGKVCSWWLVSEV